MDPDVLTPLEIFKLGRFDTRNWFYYLLPDGTPEVHGTRVHVLQFTMQYVDEACLNPMQLFTFENGLIYAVERLRVDAWTLVMTAVTFEGVESL